jgi:glycosyltransferase involved in cell wall biosynthesis
VIHSRTGEFQVFYDESALLLKRFIKYVLGLADMIIVLGKSERVIFNKISEHDRCTVIHNSIICPKVTASLNVNPPVVCTMGELGLRKGTYDLLEAIPLVLQECPGVEFLLCGNGELAEIQDILKKKQFERSVRICGYVEGRKKEEVYLRSTVYVLPSYYEGMPRSLLEAMSYGLPVRSVD